MNAMLVAVIFLLLLFAIAYITKRRFGMLGLGLCAGALLSASWTGNLTPFIASQGVEVNSPPLSVVIATMLILLPALPLLFTGPTYDKPVFRFISAVVFALLAFTLLSPQLANGLVFDSTSQAFYRFLATYSNGIIALSILLAVADIIFTRSAKSPRSPKH